MIAAPCGPSPASPGTRTLSDRPLACPQRGRECSAGSCACCSSWPGPGKAARSDPILYCGLWRSPFQVFGPLFVSDTRLDLFPWQLLLLALAPLCLLAPGAFRSASWIHGRRHRDQPRERRRDFPLGMDAGRQRLPTRTTSCGGSSSRCWWLCCCSRSSASSRDLKALGAHGPPGRPRPRNAGHLLLLGGRDGQDRPAPVYMTTHDDSLLFVGGLLIALCWAIARGGGTTWLRRGPRQRAPALRHGPEQPPPRLGRAALALALIGRPASAWRRVRRRVNRCLLVAAPLVLGYVVVGWGREGALFAPAAGALDGREQRGRLVPGSPGRDPEPPPHLATAGNPLLGTGWGVPTSRSRRLHPLRERSVGSMPTCPTTRFSAIAAFGGLVGIVGIWLVVPVTAFLGMRGFAGATRAADRAAAMAAVVLSAGLWCSVLRRHRLPVVHLRPAAWRGDGCGGQVGGLGGSVGCGVPAGARGARER